MARSSQQRNKSVTEHARSEDSYAGKLRGRSVEMLRQRRQKSGLAWPLTLMLVKMKPRVRVSTMTLMVWWLRRTQVL